MKSTILFTFLSFTLIQAFSQPAKTDSSNNASAVNGKKDSIPYATLYFYRSYIPKMKAPVKKVPIYINDSLFVQLKANMIISCRVIKEGKYIIAIDKNGDTDIPVKIKFGQEYFFKCAVESGLWFGKPTIETIPPKEGKIDAGMLKDE